MKLELTIPTKLSEITLAKYQAFLTVANSNDDPEFIQQKMIQIFCGVDLQNVAQIRNKDVNEISEMLSNMFKQDHKYIPTFKMGGVEFGFIPNLDEITNGEYIDLTKYISDWDNMHKAMAVLYRPITKKLGKDKYDIQPYQGTITYSEVMKYAPLDAVLGSIVFFYNLANELLHSTLNYLESNQEVMNIAQPHNSGQSGGGIQASMLLLKEMLLELTMQPNFHFIKA